MSTVLERAYVSIFPGTLLRPLGFPYPMAHAVGSIFEIIQDQKRTGDPYTFGQNALITSVALRQGLLSSVNHFLFPQAARAGKEEEHANNIRIANLGMDILSSFVALSFAVHAYNPEQNALIETLGSLWTFAKAKTIGNVLTDVIGTAVRLFRSRTT